MCGLPIFRNTLSFLAQSIRAILSPVVILTIHPPVPGRRGRPSRFSDQLATAICQDVARGVAITKAFLGNGIGLQTGYDWLHHRPAFAAAVRLAQSRHRKTQAIRLHLLASTLALA